MWTLPEGDEDFSGRWREIKKGFAKALPAGEARSDVMVRRRERGIWQRRFWEHTVRDGADYAAHMDYIHFNPVKHGWVREPGEWAYSSFRTCVARGLYPEGWLGGEAAIVVAGERG